MNFAISGETLALAILWIHYAAFSVWIGGIATVVFVAILACHKSMAMKVVAGEIVSRMLKGLNRAKLGSCIFFLGNTLSMILRAE